MTLISDVAAPSPASRRIRTLSHPIFVLASIALGLLLVVRIPQIFAILFLFHGGDWHAWVSSSQIGLGLKIANGAGNAATSAVALKTLGMTQRINLALLIAACTVCSGLMLFHLRQLFGLYAQGTVLARATARHLKLFAMWLAASAIAANVSGSLFETITGAHPDGIANAAMAVVLGVMIYVIASVLDLAVEADEERKEFI
jgi:Protein of unknown function (DUF2975)